jgi:carboxylate-amine ligase
MMKPPSLTVGIEEEYLLVDPATRNLVTDPNQGLWDEAYAAIGDRVTPEFLRAQMEVGTLPQATIQDLAEDLRDLRKSLGAVAASHDAAIIASSTHPFALWWEQKSTDKERYQTLASDLGVVAHRLVICGMHVHAGVEDPEMRIDLMNQVSYFLPHLLALSTSSPFWGGRNTGLRSYRMNVFRTMPRTGLPEHFDSWSEYQRHVDVLVEAGLIPDASKIWWDIRPSVRYPTLEMRISDICTRWRDAVTIAAMYRCLLHMLFRLRVSNQRWRNYAHMLVSENVWRAQRYGTSADLMDFGKSALVPFHELIDELVELLRPDAEELGCVPEIEHARIIAREGTSAARQLERFQQSIADGNSTDDALRDVVDLLIQETLEGT